MDKSLVLAIPPPLTSIDGELWQVCPVGGAECYRVSVDTLGTATAGDAVDWHTERHHHRPRW